MLIFPHCLDLLWEERRLTKIILDVGISFSLSLFDRESQFERSEYRVKPCLMIMSGMRMSFSDFLFISMRMRFNEGE